MPLAYATLLLLAAAPGPKVHQTPVYLPRYATLQLFIRPPIVIPALRLGWEIDLIEGPRDVLELAVELGLAYTHVSDAIPFYWEYVALAGLAYRNQRESGVFWGFFLGGGPAYSGFKYESRWDPYVEGRAQLGARLAGVTLSFCAGYAQWVAYAPRSITQQYLGGLFIGAHLGWK